MDKNIMDLNKIKQIKRLLDKGFEDLYSGDQAASIAAALIEYTFYYGSNTQLLINMRDTLLEELNEYKEFLLSNNK